MSFGEKLASIMERPGQDPQDKDDVPWWMKYGGRGLGTAGGFFAILVGAFNLIFIVLASVSSFLCGICLIVAGVIVLAAEAPCCCMFLDLVQTFSNIIDKRPYWNRAVLYCGLAILPLIFNFSFMVFFACGLIFGTGVLYGMMSIGKKGTRSDMAAMAASPSGMVPPPGTVPSTDHHTTLMEDPDVWRPT